VESKFLDVHNKGLFRIKNVNTAKKNKKLPKNHEVNYYPNPDPDTEPIPRSFDQITITIPTAVKMSIPLGSTTYVMSYVKVEFGYFLKFAKVTRKFGLETTEGSA
jgi:hypothetical protein